MSKAPNARLGSSESPGEEREIKEHLFYRNVNWQKLADREVQPPFKPHVVSMRVQVRALCVRVFT
jgi:hypothetical protein